MFRLGCSVSVALGYCVLTGKLATSNSVDTDDINVKTFNFPKDAPFTRALLERKFCPPFAHQGCLLSDALMGYLQCLSR